jgi:hypothetical protein
MDLPGDLAQREKSAAADLGGELAREPLRDPLDRAVQLFRP